MSPAKVQNLHTKITQFLLRCITSHDNVKYLRHNFLKRILQLLGDSNGNDQPETVHMNSQRAVVSEDDNLGIKR